MKTNKIILSALTATAMLSACSLDTPMYDYKNDDQVITKLSDLPSVINGGYNAMGGYQFLGNYAVATSDFVGGVSLGSASSGHFLVFSEHTFSDTNEELKDLWGVGYLTATQGAMAVKKGKEVLAEDLSASDRAKVSSYVAQGYALKAQAFYTLVNYFALPYSAANASKPGIVVFDMERPAEGAHVERASVQQSYDRIVADLDSAAHYMKKAGNAAPTEAFYFGQAGLNALRANVMLSMGKYAEAEEAAKAALAAKYGSAEAALENPTSTAAYVAMWGQTTEQPEDLMTIKKSSEDNLSANSLNTLYGSYYATFQNSTLEKLGANDIRRQLLMDSEGGGTTSIKYEGRVDQAVSNIPVYRASEMTLIIAECAARLGNTDEAKNYLFFTARRNQDVTMETLPTSTSDLLTFIQDERVREFFGEGKVFFNARRMGVKLSSDKFTDWDVQKFVFPIPSTEVNSGWGVQQNENWSDNLPK